MQDIKNRGTFLRQNEIVFSNRYYDSHEDVVFYNDSQIGLKAIIAIHNTSRGPAVGGCRFLPYATEDEALQDVLRLSRAMTYKAALANLNIGGGKSVIIGEPEKIKTPELMKAFGCFVEKLNGMYIIGEDVGTSLEDMEQIRKVTKYVRGFSESLGGSGDPSIMTSYGVFMGIKACLAFATNNDSLDGRKIAIQGLGRVGMRLAERLYNAGAKLIITDINHDNMKAALSKIKAEAVSPDEILDIDAEVFSPCALGGVINDQSIERVKFKIIAGAANNQLKEPYHGEALMKKGIIYAPDYVINAGGLINIAHEGPNYDRSTVLKVVINIYNTLLSIMRIAEQKGISTRQASDLIAEEYLR